jgi:hypothetical protein
MAKYIADITVIISCRGKGYNKIEIRFSAKSFILI